MFPKTMKIIFIGGVEYSKELLLYILKKGWKISILFSYNESKKKFYSDYACFDEISKEYGIKHVKVNNINDAENIQLIKKTNPDLILVMGWSQLLKSDLIQIPRLGVIGSHPTELPKYRGRAPIPWSIIKELNESALTFFYIQDGVDDGDILDQRKFVIDIYDDATSIYKKIIDIGKEMLDENLLKISQGKSKRKKQNSELFIENWPKRTPADGKIDWEKTAHEIHNLIRAITHPYPGAFTFFKHSKLIIWKSIFSQEKSKGIGKIMEINKDGIKIGTGEGTIIIKDISINDVNKSISDIFTKKDEGLILGE